MCILYNFGAKFRMNYQLNIRIAQDSDVEHIVQGNVRSFNFRMMLYNTKIQIFPP